MDIFWAVAGLAIALVGVAVAVLAWRRPRAPNAPKPAPHEQLTVVVGNEFPVFNQPDGSSRLGDHLVGVTVRNGAGAQVRAVGFGLHLPGDSTLGPLRAHHQLGTANAALDPARGLCNLVLRP